MELEILLYRAKSSVYRVLGPSVKNWGNAITNTQHFNVYSFIVFKYHTPVSKQPRNTVFNEWNRISINRWMRREWESVWTWAMHFEWRKLVGYGSLITDTLFGLPVVDEGSAPTPKPDMDRCTHTLILVTITGNQTHHIQSWEKNKIHFKSNHCSNNENKSRQCHLNPVWKVVFRSNVYGHTHTWHKVQLGLVQTRYGSSL